jgi:hypothetical protein
MQSGNIRFKVWMVEWDGQVLSVSYGENNMHAPNHQPNIERNGGAVKRNKGTLASGSNVIKTCGGCQRQYQSHLSDSENLCARCYDLAGIENDHYDGRHTTERDGDCALCRNRPR